MKTLHPKQHRHPLALCVSSGGRTALASALAGLLSLSVYGQFVPGSGGSIPDIAPLQGVANQIPGLLVERNDRQNNYYGGGTSTNLDLEFPPPSSYGASSYKLQRSPGALSTWEDILTTASPDQDNFSFSPGGSYSYRLVVQGGEKNGYVSNAVSAAASAVDTRFAAWGLDESMFISGTMWPWVGRGLTARFTVRKLSDDSEVTDGLSYQWYRVNPKSGAMTAIPGATGATYITTEDDLGGYGHLCRATGNGTTVGGYGQVMSSAGVLVPNDSYASGLTAYGFYLNLHKSVPSLSPADLILRYWGDAGEQKVAITSVTASEGNAVFWIAASIPTGVSELTLDNESDIWGLGSEMGPDHFMQSLQITIPSEGFAPEIDVENPGGTALTDGTGSQGLGKVIVGKSSSATKFTIRNSGTANLTGLAITKAGTHAADFLITQPASTTVSPGGSTTFTVKFKPGAAGARTCSIRIASNDADENPFDITLTGTGMAPVPDIDVQQPKGKSLVDNKSSRSFGKLKVGGKTKSMAFTIKNTGSAALKAIAVKKGGTHAKDFTVIAPTKTRLSPGASTTFRVTFKPRAAGPRKATLKIRSNDPNEDPFDIVLKGRGTK